MPHTRLIEPPKGAKKQGQGTIGMAAPFGKAEGPGLSPFVQRPGRRRVATKKPIPNGHERRKISITPASIDKMMCPVKGWGNPEPAQRAFKPGRKAKIGVVKLGRGTHQRLEEKPRDGGWAKRRQPERFSNAREQKLPGVEAERRSDI